MKTWQVIGGIVAIAVFGFGYYALSPLFIHIKMDDPLPMVQEPSGTSTPAAPSPIETAPASIVDTPAHPASGTVRIVSDGNTNYVRYENFKTINGPDIYVYLAKDIDAKEFIDLGRVKATEGNVNYVVPDTVDPREYPYVLVWCKAFGVLFNSAKVY